MADSQIRSLARRIASLEKARLRTKQPTLAYSTIDGGGAIQATDENDTLTMIVGTQFDGTNAPTVVTGPTPPKPIVPFVVSGAETLQVYWDGTFEDDAVAPMDFSRVLVYAEPSSTYTGPDPLNQSLIIGQLNSATGGEITAALNPGTEYVVYFVAWTIAGKYGAASDVALGTPGGPKFTQDTFTIGATGTQDVSLTYIPIENSEHLYWNGLYQPQGAVWSRAGAVVTISDPGSHLAAGDLVTVEYVYPYGSAQVVAPPGFDPRDIAGLVAWYSAEAETAYADGAQISQWTDLSGNGNHAVGVQDTGLQYPFWESTDGAAGGPAIRFERNGASSRGGVFQMPSLAALTEGEAFATLKVTAGTSGTHWDIGVRGTSAAPTWPATGDVVELFGRDEASYSYTPTVPLTSWRRYNVWAKTSDFGTRIDEVAQTTLGSGTVAFTSSPMLGRFETNSASNHTGHIGCFVLFNRKLTASERADMDAWLTANPSGGLS